MDNHVAVALIGATTTVVCTFGSIILTRMLDRQNRKARQAAPTPAPAPAETSLPAAAPSATSAKARPRPVARPGTIIALIVGAGVLGAGMAWMEEMEHRVDRGTAWFSVGLFCVLVVAMGAVLLTHAYRAGHRRSITACAFVFFEAFATIASLGTAYTLLYHLWSDAIAVFVMMFVVIAALQIVAALVGAIVGGK
ncbi:MAG: hypothetical protein V3T53_09275 [Phycisphaerales bacterium]